VALAMFALAATRLAADADVGVKLRLLESASRISEGDWALVTLGTARVSLNASSENVKAEVAVDAVLGDGIAASLAREGAAPAGVHDLVIIGAGPAGVSAALAAKEAGLAAIVLEQGSVAESIRSFPRGKLVFDQPLGIPLVGDLWLKESTKEELLGHWLRIVRQRQLRIFEQHRLLGASLGADRSFEIVARKDGRDEVRVRARRMLLAIGRRGTARKLPLPIPEALQSRVHYHLADARSFAGQPVLVVGLGDVAMEAAIALAHQAGTHVTISYRGDGFTRGKARNAAELKRLVEAGRVRPVVSQVVAPEGVPAVHEALRTGTLVGRGALLWTN